MTRDDAAKYLEGLFAGKEVGDDIEGLVQEEIEAADVAVLILNEKKKPDEHGLMPCGCGGKAYVWPSDLRQAMVTAYQVGCIECAMTTVWVRGKQENAVKVWNTAMGWKGGAE